MATLILIKDKANNKHSLVFPDLELTNATMVLQSKGYSIEEFYNTSTVALALELKDLLDGNGLDPSIAEQAKFIYDSMLVNGATEELAFDTTKNYLDSCLLRALTEDVV